MGPEAEWRHDSRKLRSFFDRDGCRSLRSALASIWRIRSRVTAKSCPTSSSVCSQPSDSPKRSRSTFSSRGVSVLRTLFVCSRSESPRSEEHTSELQSRLHLVCRLLLEKKKKKKQKTRTAVIYEHMTCKRN